ncbi:MAG TPA: SIMPL domain-containing protein, partial [Acidimicrobiales bacterium]
EVAAAVFAFTKNGVSHADVQTTNLSLQPNYVYPKGVQTISGYAVSNTVTAALHHTKTAGAAIDAVVTATGNSAQISSLTFSFNNPSAIEDRARTDAVKQATSHARAIAKASGHGLGVLCSLTDQTQTTEPYLPQNFAASGSVGLASPATAAVPVSAGTQSETDQVKMIYAIKQS